MKKYKTIFAYVLVAFAIYVAGINLVKIIIGHG